METNKEIIDDLAKDYLTTSGLNDAMAHSQEMMEEVKKILKEVAEKNPEATKEEVIESARIQLDKMLEEKTFETQANGEGRE